MSNAIFEDERFQKLIVSLSVKDRQFLKDCRSLLDPKDFRIEGTSFSAPATLVKLALAHYDKYQEPIGDLLSVEVLSYVKKHNLKTSSRGDELTDLAERTLRKKVKAATSVTEKVLEFKRAKLKQQVVGEMAALHKRGELTDEKWLELSRRAILAHGDSVHIADYFTELDKRIDRRRYHTDSRFPVLFIDPLDVLVRAIARGHVGLLLAPWKRGKSMALIHIALAYVLQRLNVLYVTLEDPQEDVEDRFDAALTQLPIKSLGDRPRLVKKRFSNFCRLSRARLRIVDGTEKDFTVSKIDSLWDEQRNQGFIADAVFIDYDDEIKPMKRYAERRMEFAEIYRDLRKFSSKRNILLWTAAQTRRGTDQVKAIVGDHLAEDISKVRKVSFALGLGKGDWGDDSLYLNVAAHKFDRQHVGCHIVSDKDRMLIYSREKTVKAQRKVNSGGEI